MAIDAYLLLILFSQIFRKLLIDQYSNLLFFFQVYSEESNSEPDVDLENQYYNSKSLKEGYPQEALESFQKVNCSLYFSNKK